MAVHVLHRIFWVQTVKIINVLTCSHTQNTLQKHSHAVFFMEVHCCLYLALLIKSHDKVSSFALYENYKALHMWCVYNVFNETAYSTKKMDIKTITINITFILSNNCK